MDRVFIENLTLKGKHGVGEEERRVPQEFRVDVSAEFDTRTAAGSDVLDDTLNYSRFRGIVREVIEGPSCILIEALAGRIAARVLEDRRISSVTVVIRKSHVYKDAVPGVSIVRTRA